MMTGAQYLGTSGMMTNYTSIKRPIFLSNLGCDDHINSRVLDCDSSPHGRPEDSCSHDNDVWIHCEGKPAMQ